MRNRALFGLVLALSPILAFAGKRPAMDLELTCDPSVREFFAPLVQRELIYNKPDTVDRGSVNHFRPKKYLRLSVYGLPVEEVFGYTNDPLLFVRQGVPPLREVYGVIVLESTANVQAQLASVGASKAQTFRVDGRRTAVVCKGESL